MKRDIEGYALRRKQVWMGGKDAFPSFLRLISGSSIGRSIWDPPPILKAHDGECGAPIVLTSLNLATEVGLRMGNQPT